VVYKKRPIPKPKTVIRNSERCLTIQYANLLHLRQAVREAELQVGEPKETPRENVKKRSVFSAED